MVGVVVRVVLFEERLRCDLAEKQDTCIVTQTSAKAKVSAT